MPAIDIHIDTTDPPSLTQPVDFVAVAALPLVELFFVAVAVYTYAQTRRNQHVRAHHALATTLMCFGAGAHVLSAFISNGHLNSYAWFRAVQNAHCPLWDFWGKFVFGFSVWFFGLLAHQLRWIDALHGVGGSSDVLWRGTESSVERARNTKGTTDGTAYTFSTGASSAPTEVARTATRHRYIAAAITFSVIVLIALGVEFLHATQYNEAHRTCYTNVYMKLVMIAWIFGSLAFLIWALLVLRRRTRNAFMRVCSGLRESQKLLIVCTAVLFALLLINMSGMLIYSYPRTAYTLALMAMYMYSVATMHRVSFKINDGCDEVEAAVQNITFYDVWRLNSLRQLLLTYVESASSERDLRFKTGYNKLLWPVSMRQWATNKATFYGKVFHPETLLTTTSTAIGADQISSNAEAGSFCIDEDDDSAEFLDEETGVSYTTNVPLHDMDMSAEEREAASVIPRGQLVQLIRKVQHVFSLTRGDAPKSAEYVLSTASQIVVQFFEADLKGDQPAAPCQAHADTTPEPQLNASEHPALTESTDSMVCIADTADAAERDGADGYENAVDVEACGDDGAESGVDSQPGSTSVDAAMFENLETVYTRQMLRTRVEERGGGKRLSHDDFYKMMPESKRNRHVLPADLDDLHEVYEVIITGDVASFMKVLKFLWFMRNVSIELIKQHYYWRALANSLIKRRYEELLREQVLQSPVLQ